MADAVNFWNPLIPPPSDRGEREGNNFIAEIIGNLFCPLDWWKYTKLIASAAGQLVRNAPVGADVCCRLRPTLAGGHRSGGSQMLQLIFTFPFILFCLLFCFVSLSLFFFQVFFLLSISFLSFYFLFFLSPVLFDKLFKNCL